MTSPKQLGAAVGRWPVCPDAFARLRRAGIGRRAHWYYAAAICLIIVAAALRFYGLTYDLLRIDEAVVSVNSQGSFAETIAKTRDANSSPILYPALLAALLAAFPTAAIVEARGAREYGIDALLAVLMIAGLLWYRREGRKVLLCAALFTAPLLQKGYIRLTTPGTAFIWGRLFTSLRAAYCMPQATIWDPSGSGNGCHRRQRRL